MADPKEKILYPYVLDYKPGFFFNRILYQLFKKVDIAGSMKETLKHMQKEGTVVYASKYKGLLDYLLYHYNYRIRRLPYPKIAFDMNISLVLPLPRLFKVIISQIAFFLKHLKIPSPYETGFYGESIRQRIPAFISLVDQKSFIRSFIHSKKDHIQLLLETQMQMDRPVFVVPQLVLYKKDPERDYKSLTNMFFGYRDHMGFVRRIILFFLHYRKGFIDFGRPLNLKEYLNSQPQSKGIHDMTSEVRQILIERIDAQKRINIGPVIKSRQQLKEMTLTDKRIIRQIERIAGDNKKKTKELKARAEDYFEEIAADYSVIYIEFFRRVLKWLWNKLYDGIEMDKEGSAKIREWARRGPIIYIPSHKSHIDYLILNDVLYNHHIHIPRIAAGQNLAFWPMGHIFRKCGAFFIRRSFKGAKLYSEVFSRYVKLLIEEGYPIEFFIEGGRSRNGKLVFPKSGFLSLLLQSYYEGACDDLIFVPTSIIYDRIMEEKSYLKEINGGSKEKENFKQILRARRLLKSTYGKIYIRFGKPFSLKEYLSGLVDHTNDTAGRLALHLVKAINDVTIVTPLSLVATAVLTVHRKGFYLFELEETIKTLLAFLRHLNAPVADSLSNPHKAVRDTISLLISLKVVDSLEDDPNNEEPFYFVDDEKKPELEYYKNNIIHLFIEHSFVALSFMAGNEEAKSIESIIPEYLYLENLFQHEFIFEKQADITEKINSIIGYFEDSGFLERSSEDSRYKLTKLGFEKLPVWSSLVVTFVESYWIASMVIGQQKEEKISSQNMIRAMNSLGKRYHKMGAVEHVEALSQLNFKNALKFINKNILNNSDRGVPDSQDPLKKLSQLTKSLYELSHYGKL